MKKVSCNIENVKTWVQATEIVKTLVQTHIIKKVTYMEWNDSFKNLNVCGEAEDEVCSED